MATDALRVLAALLIGLVAAPERAVATTYADVLDTPAQRTELASKVLINGLARAGTRVVGVGQRGHILYSDDHGRSWKQATVPVSVDLVAVHFPTPTRGWAVGHDGVILHSPDGGVSWKRQRDGRSSDSSQAGQEQQLQALPFLDVWFADEKVGFAVGAFNLAMHTADGGASWQSWSDRMDNPESLHLNAVRGYGKDVYVAGERGLVRRIAADGTRFEAVTTPYRGSLFGIVPSADRAVLVFGMRGTALYSADGGHLWQPVATGVASVLSAAAKLGDGRLVLAGQAGQLLMSDDNGRHFRALRLTNVKPVSTLVGASNGHLILGGIRGVRVLPLINRKER